MTNFVGVFSQRSWQERSLYSKWCFGQLVNNVFMYLSETDLRRCSLVANPNR